MPLQDVDITFDETPVADDVAELIRVANLRLLRFLGNKGPEQTPGFVPSDPAMVFRTLHELVERELLPGNSFCEWGSGFGIVTGLDEIIGLDAHGI